MSRNIVNKRFWMEGHQVIYSYLLKRTMSHRIRPDTPVILNPIGEKKLFQFGPLQW